MSASPWLSRRYFLRDSSLLAGGLLLPASARAEDASRQLDFCASLPAGVVFRRASRASQLDGDGTVRNAAVDQPRFLREGIACLGVMIEAAVTGRITPAKAHDLAAIRQSSPGLASRLAQERAPDGSTGVFLLKRAAQGSNSLCDMWIAPAQEGDFCCASVWLRSPAGSGTWRLRLMDDGTYNMRHALVEVGPSWQRYQITLPLHARDVGAKRFALAISEPAAKPGSTPDTRPALTEVLAWGPQYEAARQASSYLLAAAGEAEALPQRSADQLSIPAHWLPASGGMSFHLPQGAQAGAVLLDASLADGQRLRLAYSNSGWLTLGYGGQAASGFGDRRGERVVRLEWSGKGFVVLAGQSEQTLKPQLLLKLPLPPLKFGSPLRMGAQRDDTAALGRPLARLLIDTQAQAMPAQALPLPTLLPAAYVLSFEDDFDAADVARINENASGASPGAPAWRSRYRHERKTPINGEKQIYVDRDFAGTGTAALGIEPFAIAGGVLSISARPCAAEHRPQLWNRAYTSGCITSELSHWQTYGYFEMRARMPRGKGFWPAFWLLPKRAIWPPEIDVFEGSGARPFSAHVAVIDRSAPKRGGALWVDSDIDSSDGFHIYAVEWAQDKIEFFIDGKSRYAVSAHGVHEDMYLLANLAIGSNDPNWIPDPDASTPFPGKFDIDYIRAYRRGGKT